MLTLFACPKPFGGHIGTIQRSAIRSWAQLAPEVEIILFGDEPGTAEVASAQRRAFHPVLCYINSDIILTGAILQAVRVVAALQAPFLMVGRRWALDVREELVFEDGWEENLGRRVGTHGRLDKADAIDYFCFRPGLWGDLPSFLIGRTGWDNWLIYRARARGAMVVDATATVLAVHQDHDYTHLAGGWNAAWKGPEAQANRELAGPEEHRFTLDDATHLLVNGALRKALDRAHLRRRIEASGVLHPALKPIVGPLLRFADSTHRLRARIGLAANPLPRRGTGG